MIFKSKPDLNQEVHHSLKAFFSQSIVLCSLYCVLCDLTKHQKNKVFEKDKCPPQPEDKAYVSSVSMQWSSPDTCKEENKRNKIEVAGRGRDLGRSLDQPPSPSRVRREIRRGCSGLYLAEVWKSSRAEVALTPCAVPVMLTSGLDPTSITAEALPDGEGCPLLLRKCMGPPCPLPLSAPAPPYGSPDLVHIDWSSPILCHLQLSNICKEWFFFFCFWWFLLGLVFFFLVKCLLKYNQG